MKLAVWLLFITGWLAGCGVPVPNNNNGGQTPDKFGAYAACQEFVSRSLKAPATAKFPAFRPEFVLEASEDYDTFIVAAYVDAQNGFGALLRTRFVCRTRGWYDGRWQLTRPIMFQ